MATVGTTPRATYRVQLHAGFGFGNAAEIVDYLEALGIDHLYCSPVLQAAPGSSHGYDVVDPTRPNEELGGEAGFAVLDRELRARGMGQVLDIVPNHMAITPENPWWWDVLENGEASRYASYFDVDWGNNGEPEKILLPVLGDHYGRVLEAGGLRLERHGADFSLHYHEHAFPISFVSLDDLLERASRRHASDDLAFTADAMRWLAAGTADNPPVDGLHRDQKVLHEQLERLLDEDRVAASDVDAVVAEANATPDLLDGLVEKQHYRLALWRTAGQELDYRRFFDIDTLVGLRIEDDHVFRECHARLLEWIDQDIVHGLRIDHPDGLRDPLAYFQRLRAAAPDAWIVAEKILHRDEELRVEWPIEGTTGYEFIDRAGGLFVDPTAAEDFDRIYTDFIGQAVDYGSVLYDRKRQVLRELLGSDVNRLTALLQSICARHRRHRDYTADDLHAAIVEVAACLPVYRTYVRAAEDGVREDDARYLTQAVGSAKASGAGVDPELLDFVADLLLLRRRGELEGEFAMRFQQLTGAAMAKGAEDTAFYDYVRFAASNEVGGSPESFGSSVEDFHAWALRIQRTRPRTLLTTSTHDAKRSEDVRARLYVLSEIPERWGREVRAWAEHNERHRRNGLPDRNTEYLLYQTLVGAWPIETERVLGYMEKAAREAKTHTSWIRIDQDYESALRGFVEAVLDDRDFVRRLEEFVRPLVGPGRVNSLAQTLLKITAPGVPDFYQGTELWSHTLVDPDNRRSVDYGRRRRLLQEAESVGCDEVLARADEGLPKLRTIGRALRVRKERSAAFRPEGDYRPLGVVGERAERVVAFSRGEDQVVTVIPRLARGAGNTWGDTAVELPAGPWRAVFSDTRVEGGSVPVAELFALFPVALLTREVSR